MFKLDLKPTSNLHCDFETIYKQPNYTHLVLDISSNSKTNSNGLNGFLHVFILSKLTLTVKLYLFFNNMVKVHNNFIDRRQVINKIVEEVKL